MALSANNNDIDTLEEQASTSGKGQIIRLTSPQMNGAQRRHLRSLGHPLKPVVQVGHRGLFEGLIDAIKDALLTHELIKVKVMDNAPRDTKTTALWIHQKTGAHVAQLIGRVILVYQEHPEEPKIKLPSS